MSKRTFWDEPRENVFRCAECGERVLEAEDVEATRQCARCRAPLHSCRNCRFFDTAAEKECRQPIVERIARKREGNTCDRFRPVLSVDLRGDSKEGANRNEEVRRAWEALFKD